MFNSIKIKHFLKCETPVKHVLLFSRVQLFVTPWTAAHQAPLFSTISQSLWKFMPIESVMVSNYLILCCPLLLLPSIFPSIRVFFNKLALCIRWPKYWSFSNSPSNECSGWISFRIDSSLYHFLFLLHSVHFLIYETFFSWLSGKESTCNTRDVGSIPGSVRSPGVGNENPL